MLHLHGALLQQGAPLTDGTVVVAAVGQHLSEEQAGVGIARVLFEPVAQSGRGGDSLAGAAQTRDVLHHVGAVGPQRRRRQQEEPQEAAHQGSSDGGGSSPSCRSR
jgi:hypothetical protein